MKPQQVPDIVWQKGIGLGRHPNRRARNAVLFSRCWQHLVVVILILFQLSSSGWAETSSFDQALHRVYECDFQFNYDQNADRQPDGWRRRKDRFHPAYITAEIVSRDAQMAAQARQLQLLISRAYQAFRTGRWDREFVPETIPPFLTRVMDGVAIRNCYEIKIDGGEFELVSPRFEIDSRLSYRFQADMACSDLVSHLATLELHIHDHNGDLVKIVAIPPLTGNRDWKAVESEIITLSSSTELLYGELHILVRAQQSGHGKGTVRLDNIHVYELPRISLESDAPFSLARTNIPFNVTFHALGLSPEVETASFELIDIEERVVFQTSVPIERSELTRSSMSHPVSRGNQLPATTVPTEVSRPLSNRTRGSRSWTSTQASYQCTIDQPGFYRIRMGLGDQVQRELPVSVLGPTSIAGGSFGWTLTDMDTALSNEALVDLMGDLGVGLVKLPVWVDYRDTHRLDALGKWLSRIASNDITCIGVMDRPVTDGSEVLLEDLEKLHPIATLSDSKIWFDSVEPVLTSLGMRLDWLQLGIDEDRSSVGNPELQKQLATIRNQINTIGQELKIAFGWDWRKPIEPGLDQADPQLASWNALHLSSQPPLDVQEIIQHAEERRESRGQIWTSILPLSTVSHSPRQRILDLLQQMIVARQAEIDAVFYSRVFSDEFGLFDSQQHASHLLLPWTNLAESISTKQYIGSIELPNQSTNHIFDGETGTVAIVWNDQPVRELVFLGSDIQVKDIWGRAVPAQPVSFPSGSIASEIVVGQWPLIVSNVDKNVVRWQQEFDLTIQQLPSQISEKGTLPIKVQNTLGQSAKGTVAVYAGSLFEDGSVKQPLEMEPDSIQDLDLSFSFLPDASAGNHPIEFAFHVQGDKDYRFSILREVKLGHRDLELHWKMLRLSDELVELQVELINNTASPVSFDCKLFPRGAAYQRVLIVDAAVGSTLHTRKVQVPKQKVSQDAPVWVRCEQFGTSLVLNYRLTE